MMYSEISEKFRKIYEKVEMQTPTHKFFNDKYVYRENAQKRADLELKKSKNIAGKNSIFNSLIKNKNVDERCSLL